MSLELFVRSKQGRTVEQAEIEGLGLVKAGQKVLHPKFGRGVIESFFLFDEGTITVRVNFPSHGPKALLQKYAEEPECCVMNFSSGAVPH
jgi:hypothetical protein